LIYVVVYALEATEALYCDSSKDVVYLKKRTGFIRLALETGASLVPVFSFVRELMSRRLGPSRHAERVQHLQPALHWTPLAGQGPEEVPGMKHCVIVCL
jgi:2-acylglycerol O-acyltransferase 2